MDDLKHQKREIAQHLRTYNVAVKPLARATGLSRASISGILHDPDGYPARRSTVTVLRLHLGLLGGDIGKAGQQHQ